MIYTTCHSQSRNCRSKHATATSVTTNLRVSTRPEAEAVPTRRPRRRPTTGRGPRWRGRGHLNVMERSSADTACAWLVSCRHVSIYAEFMLCKRHGAGREGGLPVGGTQPDLRDDDDPAQTPHVFRNRKHVQSDRRPLLWGGGGGGGACFTVTGPGGLEERTIDPPGPSQNH